MVESGGQSLCRGSPRPSVSPQGRYKGRFRRLLVGHDRISVGEFTGRVYLNGKAQILVSGMVGFPGISGGSGRGVDPGVGLV